jgi:hypothetical protein
LAFFAARELQAPEQGDQTPAFLDPPTASKLRPDCSGLNIFTE